MTRFALALVLALAAAAPAGAVRSIVAVEGGHEVALASLVLPTSTTGRLTLRACPTCAQQYFSANGNTTYTLGAGNPVPLAEFRTAVAQLRQKYGDGVRGVVYYDKATKRVTRVIVFPPG